MPHLASIGRHVTGLLLTWNFSRSTLSPSGLDRLQESKEDFRKLGLPGNTAAVSVGTGGHYSCPCPWEYVSGLACAHSSMVSMGAHQEEVIAA